MKDNQLEPFLKWPGGKRWFARNYQDYFPIKYNTYIEPFLGSGAVFFSQNPNNSVLSDINKELINLYMVMRDSPEQLREQMIYHQERHNKEYYYEVRDTAVQDPLQSAGRMLYLNRACYNGMYRVNKEGKFNVPIGTKNNFVYDLNMFEKYAACLKNSKIVCDDFYSVINTAQKDDFIFADPPYATVDKNNFTKYNDKLFTWEDQKKLHQSLLQARARGVQIILTNVYCKEIIEMYKRDDFYIHILTRSSNIAGNIQNRGQVKEVMIASNRKPRKRQENNG